MSDVIPIRPRGRYLAHEVGRLAGTSGLQIGQWARHELIRSSRSGPGELPRIYSFQDVAEATIVHELLDLGVPHRAIRTTVRILRDEYGDWPLTDADVLVAASGVDARASGSAGVLVRRDEELYDIANSPAAMPGTAAGWQRVIAPKRLIEVADRLRRGGWAIRELPDVRSIEVDPDRLSGRPTIRGRRIAAEKVGQLAATPEGTGTLRADYGLDDLEIDDARRWWRVVEGYEARVAA